MADYERIVLPIGRWAPDEPHLAATGNLDVAQGLLFVDGSWSRVRAPTSRASGALWTNDFYPAGIAYDNGAFIGAGAHLYQWAGGGSIVDKCKGGHYTGGFWSFAPYGSEIIATNGADPVQISALPSGAFSDLITSTTKPKGEYVCTCRSHVVLASGQQFHWSARNDATNFEPGSNRAGNSFVPGHAGNISGLLGFEDFFLIFCTFAIFRASYIGGDNVWSLQQVGSHHEGMPFLFDQSAVAVGRDGFYLSVTGPKVVRNGEYVEPIGAGVVDRWLLGKSSRKIAALVGTPTNGYLMSDFRPTGCFDGLRQIVYWAWPSYETVSGSIDRVRLHCYAYSPSDEAFSYLLLKEATYDTGAGEAVRVGPILPRVNFLPDPAGFDAGRGLMFAFSSTGAANLLELDQFGNSLGEGDFLDGKLLTKTWRASSGKAELRSIKPLWKTEYDPALTPPRITIQVNPWDGGPKVDTSGSSDDERGHLVLPEPYRASEFTFSIAIADNGGTPAQLRDFVALELLAVSEKSKRGGRRA